MRQSQPDFWKKTLEAGSEIELAYTALEAAAVPDKTEPNAVLPLGKPPLPAASPFTLFACAAFPGGWNELGRPAFQRMRIASKPVGFAVGLT